MAFGDADEALYPRCFRGAPAQMYRGAQASVCRARTALAATRQRAVTQTACLIQLGSAAGGIGFCQRMGHVSAVGRTGGTYGFGVANEALLGGCGPGMASTGLGEGVKRAARVFLNVSRSLSHPCKTIRRCSVGRGKRSEGLLLNQPHAPGVPCAIFSRLSSSTLTCRPSRLCSAVWRCGRWSACWSTYIIICFQFRRYAICPLSFTIGFEPAATAPAKPARNNVGFA